MATTIPQRELRNHAGAVLRRAEAGEVFTVTVAGRPVAQLAPLPGAAASRGSVEAFNAAFRDLRADRSWLAEHLADREDERAAAADPWS